MNKKIISSKSDIEAAFKLWEKKLNGPVDSPFYVGSPFSSPEALTDCDAYRALIDLGEDNLPFLIQKLKDGDFFLNKAIIDILGISREKLKLNSAEILSEQDITRRIIRYYDRSKKRSPQSVHVSEVSVTQKGEEEFDVNILAIYLSKVCSQLELASKKSAQYAIYTERFQALIEESPFSGIVDQQ